MLLYGPKPATMGGARSLKGGGNPVPSYEIVVHSSKYTSQSLSLFRTSDKGNHDEDIIEKLNLKKLNRIL